MRRPSSKLCIVCGAEFTVRTFRYVTCGVNDCIRERRRRYFQAWYIAHREEHIAAVTKSRRKKRKGNS